MSYNNEDLLKLIELHKKYIYNDKRRLGCLQDTAVQHSEFGNENLCETKSEVQNFVSNSEEIKQYPDNSINKDNEVGQNFPLVEQLDLSSCNGSLAKDKQAFIDKIENSENPLSFRSDAGSCHTMLRYGEFSPNNPQLRVAAAPYLGLGEYEQRRILISKQRQADYNAHISQKNDLIKNKVNNFFVETLPSKHQSYNKAVQTDIQNIHHKLVQYELRSHNPPEKELSPQPVFTENKTMHNNRSPILSRSDHRFSSSQNVRPETSKPKSILSSRRTESVRDHHYPYVPSILDGFSYEDRGEHLEKERLKREAYQLELRQQIDEKRRLTALRDEQDRREQELENRRFEQQLLKMQEEQYLEHNRDDHYRTQKNQMFRRTSEDLKMYRDDQLDRSFRKHADSESSVTSLRNTKVASRQLSHYSPPVSRRVPYSFNVPSTSTLANHPNSRSESVNRDEPRSRSNSFNRYETALNRHESLSRIDSLQRQESLNRLDSLSIKDSICRVPRRHSATQQDFSLMRRSPKSQRSDRSDRSSCSRLDDPLPIPILKAHSPVAKDLKNAIAIDSSKRSTDTVRKLEDRWQVPAVQRNIITHGDPRDGQGRSILTQLGAIRLQLQKEQLRMDETLRKRGISQPKAV